MDGSSVSGASDIRHSPIEVALKSHRWPAAPMAVTQRRQLDFRAFGDALTSTQPPTSPAM